MDLLADDLVWFIHQTVLDDKHVLARLLLRRATRLLHHAMSGDATVAEVKVDLANAVRVWRGIVELGCYDHTIVRGSRSHHDRWLQTVEDPYDMRCGMSEVMDAFTYHLQPTLYKIATHLCMKQSSPACCTL